MHTHTLALAWALTHISVQAYTEHLSVRRFLEMIGKHAGIIKDEDIVYKGKSLESSLADTDITNITKYGVTRGGY